MSGQQRECGELDLDIPEARDRAMIRGEALTVLVRALTAIDDPAELVEALNEIRGALHEVSPLKHHPVDFVRWVPAGTVQANDYNPNQVAPPEMELLRLSIDHDGYTQPIVTYAMTIQARARWSR